MGLFDVFRKSAKPEAPRPGGLLGQLVEHFELEKRMPPPESAILGEWWEQPPNDDLLLAVQQRGDKIVVFFGEPAEVTEIYLVRAGAAWRLAAGSEPQFPELRLPEVKEGLAKLSPWVEELQVFETREGVSMQYGPGATLATIEADLETAHRILHAVEKT